MVIVHKKNRCLSVKEHCTLYSTSGLAFGAKLSKENFVFKIKVELFKNTAMKRVNFSFFTLDVQIFEIPGSHYDDCL